MAELPLRRRRHSHFVGEGTEGEPVQGLELVLGWSRACAQAGFQLWRAGLASGLCSERNSPARPEEHPRASCAQ